VVAEGWPHNDGSQDGGHGMIAHRMMIVARCPKNGSQESGMTLSIAHKVVLMG